MTLFGQLVQTGSIMQLHSEATLKHNLRKFRGSKGELNTCKLKPVDLVAVQAMIKDTNASFQAATGNSPHTFSAIADSGCSHSCTPCKDDFIPGTLQKLDQPMTLGGIAGSLQIEWQGMVHWETIDHFGNILTF